MYHPILMADVMQSGRKDAHMLMQQLKTTVQHINTTAAESLRSPLTITLGDEFQAVCNSLEGAVKAIFATEEYILQEQFDLQLRYVLLLGQIDTAINPNIAYEMLGPGLTKARKILNELKDLDNRFVVRLEPNDSAKEHQLNLAFTIYQKFVGSWHEKDLKIVSAYLDYDDYKTVAHEIGIDRSNAWRRKKSLAIKEYKAIKEIIFYLVNPTA